MSGNGASDIVWTRPTETQLSREQIAKAAVDIADTKGLEAVSMRQIATALGSGTMSLYRHVRTKQEVFDLMIDMVVGESQGWLGTPSGDWRADLRALAWARRATVLRHPWLAPLLADRPFLGPNVVANTEFALAAVAGLGKSMDEMVRIISTIDAFVQGFVQMELRERAWHPPVEDTEKAQDQDPWRTGVGQYVKQLMESGDYPYFTRMVTEAEDHPDPDADFEWKLERLLAGLGSVVTEH